MRLATKLLFWLLLLAGCAQPQRVQTPLVPAGPSIVIRGARVFDGNKSLGPIDVVVRGGRIAQLGGRVPDGASVIDGAGGTLLPGLIDAHAHVFAPEQLAASAIFGVTTVLDMGCGMPKTGAALKAAAEATGSGLADLRFAGYAVTVAGGHGTEYGFPVPTVIGAGDAAAFVNDRVAEGSDYIKLIVEDGHELGFKIPTLSADALRAAIEATHAAHKLAVVHIGAQDGAALAIAAGADGLAHTFEDGAPRADLISNIAAQHMFVTPTLSVNRSAVALSNAALIDDARLAPWLGPTQRGALQQTFHAHPLADMKYAHAEESVRAYRDAHVRILAGTDAPNVGTAYGASVHGELELLVHAGLTPTEALVAATSAPAGAFSMADRGRIRVGARADLLLVRGDPTTDILATRDIVAVLIGGERIDRAAYAAKVKSELEAVAQAPQLPHLERGVLADFEDGTHAKQGGDFHVSTDAIIGGKSTATLTIVAGAHGNGLLVTGRVVAGAQTAWAGTMWEPTKDFSAADLSAAKGVSFSTRGTGATYRVMLFSKRRGRMPSTRTFVAAPGWTTLHFAWSDFDGSDGSDVIGIAFVAGPTPGAFDFALDGVTLD